MFRQFFVPYGSLWKGCLNQDTDGDALHSDELSPFAFIL